MNFPTISTVNIATVSLPKQMRYRAALLAETVAWSTHFLLNLFVPRTLSNSRLSVKWRNFDASSCKS